jgi:hypothetical protein
MIARSRLFAAAVLLGMSFAACGAGSQSALSPSANGQINQGPRSASIHKATTGFTWSHNQVAIAAGKTVFQSTLCNAGETVINGTYRKKDIGDDITVVDSFPPDNHSWEIIATNGGNHPESFIFYLLCAAGAS